MLRVFANGRTRAESSSLSCLTFLSLPRRTADVADAGVAAATRPTDSGREREGGSVGRSRL